jgi:hypothetical protein
MRLLSWIGAPVVLELRRQSEVKKTLVDMVAHLEKKAKEVQREVKKAEVKKAREVKKTEVKKAREVKEVQREVKKKARRR